LDGVSVAQVFDQPYVVAEGSSALRYFGKGLLTVGTTIGGTLAGAGVGSAVPGIGTVAGGIWGGIGGFSTGLGTSILANTEDDDTPNEPTPPDDLRPSESRAVPEPFTILGTITALGFGFTFKRKVTKKHKKAVKID
jgi:hypothetical protein